MALSHFKAVATFPTPNIADKLIFEDVDARQGNYAPLAVGTAHPDTTKYPSFVLVYQTPTKNDDTTVRRFYANARSSQDAYNYKISYPYGGNILYPRYERTYVYPRSTYTAAALASVDPVISGTTLFSEALTRADEPQIDNYFVIVTRAYDKIPSTTVQDAYNFTITYPYGANTSYPRYERTYVVPRSSYTAGVIGTSTDPVYTSAKLVEEKVTRLTDQLDNVAVLVTKTFDLIPTGAQQVDWGYVVEYPYGDKDYYRVTWTYSSATTGSWESTEASACPIPGHTSAVLIEQKAEVYTDALMKIVKIFERINGPIVTSEKINETGVIETTERRLVAAGTTPTSGGFLVVGSSIDAKDTITATKAVAVVASWPTYTDYEYDEELERIVTVTREMRDITASNPVPSVSVGQDLTQTTINQYRALRTTRSVSTSGLPSVDTYRWIDYEFPSLLTAITLAGFTNNTERKRKVTVNYDIRRGYRGKTRARFEVAYFTSAPATGTLYLIKPVSLDYKGFLFNIEASNVLVDAGSVDGTNGTNDPEYDFFTETFSWSASSPTESAYTAAIGDEKLISEEIDRFRFGLWRRTRVYVTLQ